LIQTYAGNGNGYTSGDGGPAISAGVANPFGLAFDASGNLYIASAGGQSVRAVNAISSIITTVAGGGTGGDGVLATAAQLTDPCDVKLDSAGNMYLSDTCVLASGGGGGGAFSSTNRVRRVDAVTGIITTVAGNGNSGFGGDGGPATSAMLNVPAGLAIDASGNIYIADSGNNRIRRVDAVTGIITTVAGNGTAAFAGDGGLATVASLNSPDGVAVDSVGNLYVADSLNNRVRLVNAASGIITTLAGTGSPNFNGDGIPATTANLNNPITVVLNPSGNLLIADSLNYRVRMLDMSSGLIWTLAGNGSALGCCGVVNGVQATQTPLDLPAGLAISASGALFVSELQGNRVRQVALPSPYASTAVTISANAASVPYGTPVTLTATISAINGLGSSASGQVIFLDSVAPNGLGGPGVAGGLAILTATSLSQGVHVITAFYSGDSAFGYSVSPPFTVTVTAPQASVTMAANPNPATANQPVTLTATLTPSIAPGGVTFFNGSTALGSTQVFSGTATLPGITLAAGTYSLTAQYSGNGTFPPATSPAISLTVKGSSSVVVTSSANPSNTKQGVTFTATVTPATATGTVQFLDGSNTIGSATLTNGSATFSPASLNPGTHSITVKYAGDANNGPSTSAVLTQTVQASSSVTLMSMPNPAVVGSPVTFSANVSPSTATGNVQFLDGTTVLGTTALTNGVASFTTSSLSQGSHSITASYAGDSNDTSATSAVLTLTVQASSSVVLTATPNPATVGAAVILTATVTPSSATGNVKFLDGATLLGTIALTNGVASFSTSSLTQSSHSITASYAGDSNDTSASSAVVTETVQAASSVALIATPNPATVGAAVILTATVTPASATGNVKFLDGVTLLGTIALTNGVASFTTSSLTQGPHSITASYVGDSNDTSATSAVVTETVQASSSVSLTATPNPATVGAAVILTVNVTPASATGNVKFLDGTTLLGTVALTNGVASFTTSSLTQGPHSITASYAGDANDTPATSAVVTETVQASSSVALASTPNPAAIGGAVTFTAVVTPSAATGTVQFLDGTTVLGTATLANGTAFFTTSSLAQGSHSITATYSGDANDTAATSGALSQSVRAAVGLTIGVNPTYIVGQTVTITANMNSTATGTVTFTDGGTLLATVPVTSGTAVYSSATLAQGTHSIGISYSGDTNFLSVSTTATITMLGSTSITVASSLNPALPAQAVTFTAAVTPATATGTVQFYDGATLLATSTLTNGLAAFSSSALSPGSHSITANYGGSASYAASNSSALSEVIKTGTTVTVSSSLNPAAAGSAVTFTALVSPAAATGTVQFLDGVTVIGSATLANGSASFTTASLSPGTHSVTASYGGSSNYAAANSNVLSQIVKANTSVALSSSLNPSIAGTAVTFTALVTPATATGTVQFLDGATVLGSAAISGGQASFTTSSLAQGVQSITAVYGGDAADSGSSSAPLTETVNPPAPSAPSNLTATAAGSSQINLTWTASPTAGVTYNVYEGTTSGFAPSASNRIASGVAATGYAATGLNSLSTYYYRVTAVNAGGESAATNQASATTAGALACHVNYSVTSQWNDGFTGSMSIHNTGTIKVTSWTLTWTWPGNQDVTQAWEAHYKQSGDNVTLTNESYNGQIAEGATLSGIGFNASYHGSNTAPSAFYLNGTLCH
jgi:hypothetical protein